MELYIQIRDGQPYQHPILGENFREAFPHIDVNNLPPEFARFERLACPNEATTFQVDEVSYQWVNGIVKDVWVVRDMTDEERQEKIKEIGENLLKSVENYKVISQAEIDNALTEEIKQLWIDHLAALNAWVLVDPLNPKLPKPPAMQDDGTVYTVNDSGTAPNVIE